MVDLPTLLFTPLRDDLSTLKRKVNHAAAGGIYERFACQTVEVRHALRTTDKNKIVVIFAVSDELLEINETIAIHHFNCPRDIAINFGFHLEHACGGNNACTTCHVIVKANTDGNLSEMDDDEADRLEKAPGLTLHSRLGCQCVVTGDVVVEIPNWNINYVSEGGGSINLGGAIPPPKH